MKLYNDDCINVMQQMINDGVKVDLTVTSPPYDNLRSYENEVLWDFDKFKEVANKLYDVTVDGGVVIWVVNDQVKNGSETGSSFRQALYFMEIGFRLHDTMIFQKANYIPLTHNRYEQSFEYMFCFSKGKPKTFNPIKIPCKNAGKIESYGIERRSLLDKNQVFDPFMGSGTTGKMAVLNNRDFIGVELVKNYYDISVRRIGNEAHQMQYL